MPSLSKAGIRFCLLAGSGLLALLVGGGCHATKSVPPAAVAIPTSATVSLLQPDVQVLIMGYDAGDELVDLTYPRVVSKNQAARDVTAIAQAADLPSADIDISNGVMPMRGVKSASMTSATFMTTGAIPDGSTSFRIEPWIIALRSYPNVAITYMMPTDFAFNGLRTFQDENVQIALDQQGQSYTYHVHVLNNNFSELNLPLMQPSPQVIQYAKAEDHNASTTRVVGLILLSVIAAGAGFAVYVLLSRLH